MHSDGQLYQGLNWGFDLEMSLESPVGDICWKIWTTNTMSASEPAWVDMGEDDGGYMGYQISKYERCFTHVRKYLIINNNLPKKSNPS